MTLSRQFTKPLMVLLVAAIGSPIGEMPATETIQVSKLENELPAEIVVGMSTALTGPAADLGQNMRTGVLAAFHEINKSGGIQGRTIRLIALDDGYEPTRTAPNMRRLIEEEKVLTVIGNVGTPTAVAAIPIANEMRTPFFGAYTGAGLLRKSPPDRFVINYRASYAEETAAMVDGLVRHLGLRPEEISFFTQRDGYGDAGYSGGVEALKVHGLHDENQLAHGRYERNTMSVEKGLAEILLHKVPTKAVIMVGSYGPCARFIQLAKASNLDALFLNVSFVGAIPLSNSLGTDGDGVIITQVVPNPTSQTPLAIRYRQTLQRSAPMESPTFGSFEGYIAASILVKAMNSIQGEPTRERVVDALEALGDFQLTPEQPLHLSPKEHQASHKIWPTILRNGKIVSFDWPDLKDRITNSNR